MKQKLSLFLLALLSLGFTTDKPAYLLYNQEGKVIKYKTMMKELAGADIIFFGELHTDPIAHWLQLEMTKELFDAKKQDLVLGAEMFEADNQLILDEYLSGAYETDKFEAEAKLWKNYETDYKPLVEFAKKHKLDFIATNIPRRYASMVHYKGFEALDSLPEASKQFIAPLPMTYDPEVACYKDMLNMMSMGSSKSAAPKKSSAAEMHAKTEMHAAAETPAEAEKPAEAKESQTAEKSGEAGMPAEETAIPSDVKMPTKDTGNAAAPDMHAAPKGMHSMKKAGPSMANLPKAQNAKDATMAYFILQNWTEGKTMFHFNGEYHSRNFEGIVWHLKQANPELKIMTISTVQQEDVMKLEDENTGIANFVVCVPEDMTRTSR